MLNYGYNKIKEGGVRMNEHRKLKGRIIEIYGTCSAFAKALGVSRQNVSMILSGKRGISQKVIMRWAELLDIPVEQIGEFFYT